MAWTKILRQKTTWAAIVAALTAVGGYLTGELGLAAALQLFFTAAIGAFLRQGVSKGQVIEG